MTTLCQDHWDQLRAAVDERGLGALVAESGEEAMHRTVRELEGERSIDSFDPLMNAFFLILGHAVELAGPRVMAGPGDGCFLCWMNLEHEHSCTGCSLPRVNGFDHWIDKAADATKQRWLELGAAT
jgi:hypothetical protein